MTNVTYENISVQSAYLFPIWVGPAYQELDGSCGLLWPWVPSAAVDAVRKLVPSLTDTSVSLGTTCKPTDVPIDVTIRNVRIERAFTTPRLYYGSSTPLRASPSPTPYAAAYT